MIARQKWRRAMSYKVSGTTIHLADGTIVTGTLFSNYPDEQCFYDTLQDLNGNNIEDVSGSEIKGKTVYRKV